ncbi:hypothetical protein BC830DRAFT_1087044 [Chytriomyces sp. MP71]|nr:hypothetical protein BC830DRAFT_1087044 [Chytriomyces sp. MP71]
MTNHSTEDCIKLKNYMKLKDQLQKVQDGPNVKNALQKHNGSEGAKAATAEKKAKGAQSPVQKTLCELAKTLSDCISGNKHASIQNGRRNVAEMAGKSRSDGCKGS